MTGSLTVKNGKYYAVLNVYENGKRKKKWISTDLPEKGNKRKAEQFLREKLAEYERMEGIVKTDVLFSDYVRIWLEHIARKVDTVTMQGYQVLADGHILPYFDECKIALADLDYKDVQRYIDIKAQSGRLDGKGGLSPRSLKLHKNIINQTLNLALQNKLILANPCQFVVLPQSVRYESTFYNDKTKNASSRRTFPLTEEALEIFKAAKCQEQQNRLAFGREYQENAYVFKWPDGHPYSPDYVSKQFNKLLKKHNLPHIRFHELRHSCASMLLGMGWNLKDIQEWLGHSDIKMTANLYSHLDVARKNNIANSLAEKFGA